MRFTKTAFLLLFCIFFALAPLHAGAAPSAAAPAASPSTVIAGQETTVTVTSAITSDPGYPVIATGVYLQRVDATGRILWSMTMRDDGLGGDATAGDGIFTRQLSINESAPVDMLLRVSAPFTKILKRVLSPVTVLRVVANSAPVANAGPDQTVFVGSTITLNGSGSSDADGNPLTYSWLILSAPTGSAAALSDPAAVNPTFVADKFGDYIVQLIVNDGTVNSASDTVTVSTLNSAPVANAGPDQTAFAGDTVTLNGGGSTDVDGDLLTYSWSLTSHPAGSTATLSDTTAVSPTFTVDRSGSYTIQLIVNDGTVNSAADTVTISTQNSAPVANAGPDQTVFAGMVTLDGSGSADADGDPLMYNWSLTTKPAGSAAALANPTTVSPTFIADKVGTYVAQLIVNDGMVDSAADTVTIDTQNSAPVANAGPDQTTVLVGDTVTLNGGGSTDADSDPLAFFWSFLSLPAGSTATLSDTTAVSPTLTVDRSGVYIVQLIVNDGTVNSAPDTVTISTQNSAPVAVNDSYDVLEDSTLNIGSPGVLGNDTDADGNTLTASLVSASSGPLALNANGSFSYTPPANFNGSDSFIYKNNDGTTDSNTATVAITVQPVNDAPTLDPISDLTINQNAGLQTVNLTGIGTGAANELQTLTITATSNNTALIPNPTITYTSPNTTGSLGFTPASGQSGTATVTVTVQDNGGTLNGGVDTFIRTFTVTVNPPAIPTVAITASDQNAAEASSDPGTFTVTRTGATTNPLTVSYTVSGTATNTDDYAALSGSITIPAGQSSAAITIAPVDDTQIEGAETVILTLAADAAYVIGALSSATVTIADNDVLSTMTLSLVGTPLVGLNQSATLRVTLAQPAPAGGVTVTVTSDNTGLLTVTPPGMVTIAEGSTTGNLTVNGAALGTVTVRGNATGFSEATLSVTVSNNVISIGNVEIGPGAAGSVPVTLSQAAPPGGLVVTLTSSNPSILSFASPTVTIPAGALVASPNPVVNAGTTLGTVALTASGPGYVTGAGTGKVSLTATLTPATLNLVTGRSELMTVSISQPALAGGVTINLAASDPTKVSVPAQVTIPQGNTSIQFSVSGLAAGNGIIVTASGALTSTTTATVNVAPAPGITYVYPNYQMAKDTQDDGFYVQLGAPAPAGGVTVTLTSSDP
ncbi:MAG: PKD domain-containing protein, partial [Nitrospirota bacterium]